MLHYNAKLNQQQELISFCEPFAPYKLYDYNDYFSRLVTLLPHYIRLTAFFQETWLSRYQKGKPFWILL